MIQPGRPHPSEFNKYDQYLSRDDFAVSISKNRPLEVDMTLPILLWAVNPLQWLLHCILTECILFHTTPLSLLCRREIKYMRDYICPVSSHSFIFITQRLNHS